MRTDTIDGEAEQTAVHVDPTGSGARHGGVKNPHAPVGLINRQQRGESRAGAIRQHHIHLIGVGIHPTQLQE